MGNHESNDIKYEFRKRDAGGDESTYSVICKNHIIETPAHAKPATSLLYGMSGL